MNTILDNPITENYTLIVLIMVCTTITVILALITALAIVAVAHPKPSVRRDSRIALTVVADMVKNIFG